MANRFVGPIFKAKTGPQSKSSALLGLARHLVQLCLDKLEANGGRGHEFIQQRLADGSRLRASVLNMTGQPLIKVWVDVPSIVVPELVRRGEAEVQFPRGFIFIPVRLDAFWFGPSEVSVGNADANLDWSIFDGDFETPVHGDSICWGLMVDEWSDPAPARCAWIAEFPTGSKADAMPLLTKWVAANFGNCYWAGQDEEQFDVLSWNDNLEASSPVPAGGRLGWAE